MNNQNWFSVFFLITRAAEIAISDKCISLAVACSGLFGATNEKIPQNE